MCPERLVPALPALQDGREASPHAQLRTPRGAVCARANRCTDHIFRLSADAEAETAHAPRWGSRDAGECGRGRARGGVVEPRILFHALVTALAVKDVCLRARCDEPELARVSSTST
jgi:hypothetical protein